MLTTHSRTTVKTPEHHIHRVQQAIAGETFTGTTSIITTAAISLIKGSERHQFLAQERKRQQDSLEEQAIPTLTARCPPGHCDY